MNDQTDGSISLARYRPWFYAAAAYNLVWGIATILWPDLLFDVIGMAHPNYPTLWQVVGMFVMVYAPAYWWVARQPLRHRHWIVIGLLGKLLGPIGYVWAVAGGRLPPSFGWIILTNDLIWWPAFVSFLHACSRLPGGWKALLLGE